MKLYVVDYRDTGYASHGYSWHASKRAANQAGKVAIQQSKDNGAEAITSAEIGQVGFAPTRRGVLRLLNLYAVHPDNG